MSITASSISFLRPIGKSESKSTIVITDEFTELIIVTGAARRIGAAAIAKRAAAFEKCNVLFTAN